MIDKWSIQVYALQTQTRTEATEVCPALLLEIPLAGTDHLADDTFGTRLRAARQQAHLSQRELGRLSGVSKTWIVELENGLKNPRMSTVVALERALGVSLMDRHETTPESSERSDIVVDYRLGGGLETRRRPVYRWGSAGDPRTVESSPYPDHERYPPPGKESLIGTRGFAVLVRGESMANWDIHDGDIAWVNPDKTAREGVPVLVCAIFDGGDSGMLIKVIRNGQIWGDGQGEEGANPVLCSSYETIGVVVWTEHGKPPQRHA